MTKIRPVRRSPGLHPSHCRRYERSPTWSLGGAHIDCVPLGYRFMCNCQLDKFGCCDELLLGVCAIVLVVRPTATSSTPMDTNTELLPDINILDRWNEIAREGFAEKARIEIFCFFVVYLKWAVHRILIQKTLITLIHFSILWTILSIGHYLFCILIQFHLF